MTKLDNLARLLRLRQAHFVESHAMAPTFVRLSRADSKIYRGACGRSKTIIGLPILEFDALETSVEF